MSHLKLHGFGDQDNHEATVLSAVNALISDATLATTDDINWTLSGTTITPVLSTNSLTVPAGATFSTVEFTGDLDVSSANRTIGWDSTYETMKVGSTSGSFNTVGFEDWVKIYNNTGSTIYNGQPVAYSQAVSGGWPTVFLSQANATGSEVNRRAVYGIATQDIPNGDEGIITSRGRINDINTSGWVKNTELWLSETQGELTSERPLLPSSQVRVGIVTDSHATSGKIDVRVEDLSWVGLTQANNAAIERTGFTLKDGVPIGVAGFPLTISGENVSRTFQISSLSNTIAIYSKSNLFFKTGDQEVTWSDVEGSHYFYFDEEGVLQHSITYSDNYILGPEVFAGYIYWDGTNKRMILDAPFNEAHGLQMDGATHLHFHDTLGAQVVGSGLSLNNLDTTGSGDDNTHAQFGVDSGVISDEDLFHTIISTSSLSGLPILYFDGAAGNLRETTETGFSVLTDITAGVGATGRLVYNEWTGATWQLTTVGNNDHVLCHVFTVGTGNGKNTYVVIGQDTYGSTTAARNGADIEIGNIVAQLPFLEVRPIATVIFQTANGFTNDVKARTQQFDSSDYIDWRTDAIPGGTGITPSDHNALSNRDATNSHPSTAVSTTTTNFDRILSAADTDVQLALDTLDNDAATNADVTYLSGEIDNITTNITTDITYLSGKIDDNTSNINALSAITVDTNEPNGFIDRNETTISFDNSLRRFSIAPVASEFSYYVKGVKYTQNSTITIDIDDISGNHFIYFDENGIQVTQTFNSILIQQYAFMTFVTWNATTSEHILFGDERHGCVMDSASHEYLHETRGAALESGGGLGDIIVNSTGDLDIHAQFSNEATVLWDEDIRFDHSARLSTDIMPVYYKLGPALSSVWYVNEDHSFGVLSGSTGRAVYNEFTGTDWQLTNISNNDFVLTHVAVTNDPNRPYICFMGQNDYLTVASARDGALTEINSLITEGIPTVEFKFVATVIYQTSNGYANAIQSRIRSTDTGDDYVDLRDVVITRGGVAGTVTEHSALANLDSDDHLQYALLSGRSLGQNLYGGTGASENLYLGSTTNATKGNVTLDAIANGALLTNQPTGTVDLAISTTNYADNANNANNDYLSGAIDAITPTISTTSTETSAASATTDFSLSAPNIVDIVRGRLYVNNVDVVPFSDTATVTFYNDSSRRGDEAIYRANMDIVADTMVSGVVSGSTIYSNDGTVFETNDLVYLSGGESTEFARISTVSDNDLNLEDSITNSYETGSLISLVPEFGGFTLYDATETEKIWGRIVLAGSSTVDMTVWMEYK